MAAWVAAIAAVASATTAAVSGKQQSDSASRSRQAQEKAQADARANALKEEMRGSLAARKARAQSPDVAGFLASDPTAPRQAPKAPKLSTPSPLGETA